jgi:prephenate dehydratase
MDAAPDPRRASARVGYLGPQGTFSEEALLASAALDAVEPVAHASIYETVMALRRGELDWAIVPIENSLEGSVSVTLDLLAGEASDVQIAGEALLGVRHSLIAADTLELDQIEAVLTHPQVPGQCTRFLRAELPRAQVLPASSTAEAVRIVSAERGGTRAALGTLLAAEIYGATVLREAVQDRDDNETRFVWLARAGEQREPPLRERTTGDWRTSLLFWGAGAARPGWLVRCLQEFAQREINLTKIESRPLRERLGSYMFFVDLSARASDASVAEAIEALGALCEEVRVLGSYPTA